MAGESIAEPGQFHLAGRAFAGALALLGWAALGVEFASAASRAEADGVSLGAAVIRYFSFFTIQTNLLLALVLTLSCIHREALLPEPRHFLLRPGVKAAALAYIIIVAVVYNLLLRHLYHPKGMIFVADRILHDVVPVLYPLYWLAFCPKDGVRWKDSLVWLSFPILYFLYILARGAISGEYPYPFLNVGRIGYGQVMINALGLLAAFLAVGVSVAALARILAARARNTGEWGGAGL